MNYFDWAMASIAAILSLPGRVIFFEVNPFGVGLGHFQKIPSTAPIGIVWTAVATRFFHGFFWVEQKLFGKFRSLKKHY